MIVEPTVVEGECGTCAHMMWAMWDEDDEGVDAHIGFWRTRDGLMIVQSMQSNADVRGRDMLKWLERHRLPIHVVEAIPEAFGFWDRMMDEGIIATWEPATGMPSMLERRSVPYVALANAA